jgi:hypothetical protein
MKANKEIRELHDMLYNGAKEIAKKHNVDINIVLFLMAHILIDDYEALQEK